MRRHLRIVVVVAIAVAGIVAAGAAVTSSRLFTGQKACGGFHVVLENASGSAVELRINDLLITTVQPNESANVAEYGGGAGPMPWDVRAIRANDGAVLATGHFEDDGSDGRTIRVLDTSGGHAAIVNYSC